MSDTADKNGEDTGFDPQTAYDVRGRVVIVTGAGQGIGRAYARGFARAGAVSIVADIDEENGAAVAREIEQGGGRALAVATDVTDEEAVARLIDTVIRRFGRIDVLVNNAAIFAPLGRRPFYEIPLEEWRAVMDVNIAGSFLCAKAVVPAMREAGWGRIINIASNVVPLGLAKFTHYVASKAGVIGMTRAMAREVGEFGITVNAVLPGLTVTEVDIPHREDAVIEHVRDLQCVPRTQVPDDLVGTVIFLASPAADFISGQSIMVDGGAAHL